MQPRKVGRDVCVGNLYGLTGSRFRDESSQRHCQPPVGQGKSVLTSLTTALSLTAIPVARTPRADCDSRNEYVKPINYRSQIR